MKKFNHILAAAFLTIASNSFAGDCSALIGQLTIGKGDNADFATITEAVSALKCGGVSGPVTFQLQSGTYNERVVIPAIPGASAFNTITFESSGDATISMATSDATLVFDGASYVTFQNIMIDHHSATYGNCMRVDGKANSLRFKSVAFDGVESARTGANNATIYFTENAPKTGIMFEDCEINNGSSGIYKNGVSATNMDTKTSITGTLFFNQFEAGLSLTNEDAPVITNNVFSTLSNHSDFKGINLNNIANSMVVSNNIVNAANGTVGISMNNCNGQLTNFGQISNNSIAVGGTNQSYGIYLSGSTDNQLMNFNRVKLTMNKKATAGQAYYRNAGSGNNINMMNSMFYDLNTGGYTIVGNTYKDAFNQMPSQQLTASANGISVEKVSPIK